MAETVLDPPPVTADQPVDGALTYQRVLDDHPDMHPDLRTHVERLAAEEAGERVLESTALVAEPTPTEDASALARPEPEASPAAKISPSEVVLVEDGEEDPTAGLLGKYAQHLHEQVDEASNDVLYQWGHTPQTPILMNEHIRKGEYSDQELADFMHEGRRLADVISANNKAEGRNVFSEPEYHTVLESLQHLPVDRLRAIYQSDTLSGDLKYMIANSVGARDIYAAANLMRDVYGHDDVLDLVESDGPGSHDPVMASLSRQEFFGPGLLVSYERHTPQWPEGTSPLEETKAKRDWGDRFLKLVVGLSETQRNELLLSSFSRTTNRKTGFIDSEAYRSMLNRTAINSNRVGMERLQELRTYAGIMSLDYYRAGQLLMTSDVIRGDADAIEHLQAGDVTVVFASSKGDYNGAVKSDAENFATESERTLFFELTQPSDFYRYMLLLNKRGIKPSTIVMSSHGNPGSFAVGSGDNKYEYVNGLNPDFKHDHSGKRVHIMEAKGLQRVVGEMMQDSRGIDDNPDNAGRRRLILAACSQAKRERVTRIEEFEESGFRRLWNRIRRKPTTYQAAVSKRESMAETVLKTAAHPNLDVYASDIDLSVNPTEDATGVRFDMVLKDDKGNEYAQPHPVTQLTLASDGNILEQRLEYVELRPRKSDEDESTKGEAA